MWVQLFIFSLIVIFVIQESSAFIDNSHEETKLRRCYCAHYDCGCCTHIEVDFAKVNGTLCSDMKYLTDDIGVSLTITYNKLTIYNETVSVRNPPKICPILVEDVHIEACIRFYDMEFDRHHFNGCAEAEVSAFRAIPLVKKDLGCFHMGHQNSTKHFIPYSVVQVIK